METLKKNYSNALTPHVYVFDGVKYNWDFGKFKLLIEKNKKKSGKSQNKQLAEMIELLPDKYDKQNLFETFQQYAKPRNANSRFCRTAK